MQTRTIPRAGRAPGRPRVPGRYRAARRQSPVERTTFCEPLAKRGIFIYSGYDCAAGCGARRHQRTPAHWASCAPDCRPSWHCITRGPRRSASDRNHQARPKAAYNLAWSQNANAGALGNKRRTQRSGGEVSPRRRRRRRHVQNRARWAGAECRQGVQGLLRALRLPRASGGG